MVRGGVRRGFEILVLAYLFRLQEFVLSFFWDWRDLFRRRHPELPRGVDDAGGVDGAPRRGGPSTRSRWRSRRRWSPWGRSSDRDTTFPAWLPRHLAAYIAGHDKMAAFP